MAEENRGILKSQLKYHLLKMLPFGTKVKIELKNGLTYFLRSKTMDKSVLKEVWITNVYNQFGVKVEEGDTVIDIGAHVGIFSTHAAEISKTGQVYAFEPFIENFKMLKQHAEINGKKNLSVYNLGMTGSTGKRTLNLSPDNNTGGHSLHLKTNTDRTIEIETTTLTGFCAENKIEHIDFLKLDCEGAEFEIIESDPTILDRVKKVILECHPYGDKTIQSMVSLLEKHGFTIQKEDIGTADKPQMLYGKRVLN